LLGANSDLPADVNVTWVKPVSDDFHARFAAVARTYRYLILNRFERSALHRNRAWWVYDQLSIEPMQKAAKSLLGEHDFSGFRAAACQASTPVRNISHLSLAQRGPWIELEVTANAFLQHMVRNIMGTLVMIGRGDESPGWAAKILASRDRKKGGIAAPPHGLTLVSVAYPDEFDLPADPNANLR
jgi:tRNA pseudouridine38-40 synthase